MLELRPNCEWCDRDLPPEDGEARICTYECTYCAACVDGVLHNVCPTCGGGFSPRPIRPRREWRPGSGLGLSHHPASDRRRRSGWSEAQVAEMIERIVNVEPQER